MLFIHILLFLLLAPDYHVKTKFTWNGFCFACKKEKTQSAWIIMALNDHAKFLNDIWISNRSEISDRYLNAEATFERSSEEKVFWNYAANLPDAEGWFQKLPKRCRNLIEIALLYGCSPVNLLHVFRTPFPKNTSLELLLWMGCFQPKI